MKKQLKRFIAVGIATVAIDFLVYKLLVVSFGQIFYFKGISFIAGAVFSYVCNSLFSFEQKKLSKRQLLRFIGIYTLSLVCNVHVNGMILAMPWHGFEYMSLYVSFIIATSTSAFLNYTLMSCYVFKKV